MEQPHLGQTYRGIDASSDLFIISPQFGHIHFSSVSDSVIVSTYINSKFNLIACQFLSLIVFKLILQKCQFEKILYLWNKKKKKDTYWIKTKNPITNPWADAVTVSAFNAPAVISIVIGPKPKIIPASRVLSVFIAPGSRVVPQLLHPLHS